MAADFPSSIANINRPTAGTKRNAPGYEGHALHAKLADEIEAIEGVIGVTGSTVPTSIEYRLADVNAVAQVATGDIVVLDSRISQVDAELTKGVTRACWPNELINTLPTVCVQPYSHAGVAQYATTLAGTAAASKDDEIKDPTTGMETLKLVLGVGDDATQTLRWDSLASTWTMGGPDDVYLLPIWLPDTYALNDNMYLRLRFTSQGTPSTNYRFVNVFGGSFHPGWQILIIKNTEVSLGASEYGTVGTAVASQVIWYDYGTMTHASTVNGFRIEVINGAGLQINFGALHRAPAGWCKAVVCWSEDDGLQTFHTLGRPIIESYGWPITHNLITRNCSGAASPNFTLTMGEIRTLLATGNHEFWSHTADHTDLAAADSGTRARALREAAAFGMAQGLPSIARYIAYPYGSYDATVLADAAAAGYRIGRGGSGRFHSSWCPGISLMALPSINLETSNPWHADAHLNGAILRGQLIIPYLHSTISGGSGVNSYPASSQHYADHLTRWCDLVAAHEDAGRVVCMKLTEYFRAVGIDPGQL